MLYTPVRILWARPFSVGTVTVGTKLLPVKHDEQQWHPGDGICVPVEFTGSWAGRSEMVRQRERESACLPLKEPGASGRFLAPV